MYKYKINTFPAIEGRSRRLIIDHVPLLSVYFDLIFLIN